MKIVKYLAKICVEFLLDTECFKPKIPKSNQAVEYIELPDLNTKDKLTSTPSQSYDSTKKTKSKELMNMNTTTSFLQKNKTNTNKIKQTVLPSVSSTSHLSSLHGSWAMSILR